MEIRYNVTGAERKRLVNTIADTLEVKAKYLGAPSMAYEVDTYTVGRDGTLSFSDRNDSEEVERVLEALVDAGFECEGQQNAESAENETADLTVEIPLEHVGVGNLTKLLDAKGSLIKKALGISDLGFEITETSVRFPWFGDLSPEEIHAYSAFIAALCKMSKEAKRVTATEKDVESEKYAFRGFLLRLGFIGAGSKADRKILLKNLSGSAAFPSKAAADAFSAAQKAKREASKEDQQ